MPFTKGDPNINRAGKPPGTKNKPKDADPAQEAYRTLTNAQRKELARRHGDITPLDLLLSIARDENCGILTRIKAAEVAAPYLHQKLPLAVQVEQGQQLQLAPSQLAKLTPGEKLALLAALAKMGVEPVQDSGDANVIDVPPSDIKRADDILAIAAQDAATGAGGDTNGSE